MREGVKPASEKIVYTSTHDTSTLVGWTSARWAADAEPEAKQELALSIIKDAFESDADLVMLQLQDVMLLDDDARMNVPGTAEGNWSWQADEDLLVGSIERIHDLATETGRANSVEQR